MQLPTIPKIGRLSKKHKITAAGAAAAAAVALAVTGLQATGGGSAAAVGDPTGFQVSAGQQVKSLDAKSGLASQRALSDHEAAQKHAAAAAVAAKQKAAAAATAAKKQAADAAAAKSAAAKKAAAVKAAPHKAVAHKKAVIHKKAVVRKTVVHHTKKATTAKSTHRVALKVTAAAPAKKIVAAPVVAKVVYPNNLDGWIRESLAVMHQKGIPGSYDGIYRNIIRESSGNPNAINLWDINAQNGIPSKGLLQVIDPTFQAYHVAGTSWNIYDPVANITAACNYAADRYGSMDNVNSAY